MRYTTQSHITTIEDVQDFARYLYNERKVAFHPDDDFADYAYYDNGEAMFTDNEVPLHNRLMKECFTVCDQHSEDIYGVMIEFNPIYQYFQKSAV